MYVIHEQRDRCDGVGINILPILLPLLPKLLVKLHEEQGLVLDVGEQVVLADEVENVWSAEAEEVRESLARLAVERVQLGETFHEDDRLGSIGFRG